MKEKFRIYESAGLKPGHPEDERRLIMVVEARVEDGRIVLDVLENGTRFGEAFVLSEEKYQYMIEQANLLPPKKRRK